MKNLLVAIGFLTLILYLGTALLFLLYNIKRPAETRIYLIIAFLLISGTFSFWLVEIFYSSSFLTLIRQYLFALGLIFFTTVIVEILSGSSQIGFYYLLTSLGLTSLFTLIAIATLDFNKIYYLQWSFPVWIIVQVIILGILSYFLIVSFLKTKQKGTIVYSTIFILFLAERLIEGLELLILKKTLEPFFLAENLIHLVAAILIFTYAAYGLIKISIPRKSSA